MGFTLIELLVVVAILSVLIVFLALIIDPLKQINKTKDAQRDHDFLQIKNALDVYYNDHNCYPISIPFGQEWTEATTLYMKKVPQDPDYPRLQYVYQIDFLESCPQWNVIYARHREEPSSKIICPLTSIPDCLPIDYQSSYACATLGSVNCPVISASQIGSIVPVPPTLTPTPTTVQQAPTNTPTPTPSGPTPTPENCPSKDYKCSGDPQRCNIVPAGTGDWCTPQCGGACPGG